MGTLSLQGATMEVEKVYASLWQHLRTFFAGHPCEEHVWTLGPAIERFPRVRVAEFVPGPKTRLWVYASVGAWEARPDRMLEFLIIAPESDLRHVELLAMTAGYHRDHKLGWAHTFPIGESWLPGSNCDSILVSLPYPFGPDLEICQLPEGHIQYLWLLPITGAEREFFKREGLEALEQRFDDCALEYWKPLRDSVV
jgi:hypothetical protein